MNRTCYLLKFVLLNTCPYFFDFTKDLIFRKTGEYKMLYGGLPKNAIFRALYQYISMIDFRKNIK